MRTLRAIELPNEHGGWSLLAEPLLAGLIVAPTAGGALLALLALLAFFIRHPLRLVAGDLRRGGFNDRTRACAVVTACYAALAAPVLFAALSLVPAIAWSPLIVAAPFAAIQALYDARGRGRELPAEASGAVALSGVVAMLMLAGRWPAPQAAAAFALLAAKSFATILYVRSRLRLDRGQPSSRVAALAAHAAALALAASAGGSGLAAAAFGVLLLRAAYGLSPWRRPARPQAVGFAELGYGVATALTIGIGYRLGA